MNRKTVSPYSFSVKQEGKRAYAYQVICYPYKNPLMGGICNSRRDAERCARKDIAKLESVTIAQEQTA